MIFKKTKELDEELFLNFKDDEVIEYETFKNVCLKYAEEEEKGHGSKI